jgi:hypothetical protein
MSPKGASALARLGNESDQAVDGSTVAPVAILPTSEFAR